MVDPSTTELEELRALRIELISQNNQIKQRLLTLEKENKFFKTKFHELSAVKKEDDEKSNINKAQYSKEKKADQELITDQEQEIKKLEERIQQLGELQKEHEKELEDKFHRIIDELEKEKEDLQEKLEANSTYMKERDQRAEEIN